VGSQVVAGMGGRVVVVVVEVEEVVEEVVEVEEGVK